MERIIGAFLLFFITLSAQGQKLNINDIRKEFKNGVKDEELCKKYLKYLQQHSTTPVEKGYQAAFNMFMAKHTNNPFKKMSHFNSGKKLLEQQIKLDPDNAELRFIRLCIQYHIPDYLGYKSNVKEDKSFMLSNLYKLQDSIAKKVIFKYLKGTNMYSEEELKLLGR